MWTPRPRPTPPRSYAPSFPSMSPLIEENEDPPDGTVVATLIEGGEEVAVKRLYREDEMLRLRPENGEHEDLLLPAGEVKMQRRVIYVVHPPRRSRR